MIMYSSAIFIMIFIIPNIIIGNTQNQHLRKKNVISSFFALSYIILCGLRDSGGADDMVYKMFYVQDIGGGIFQMFKGKEPLFNLLKFIGYTLKLNYKWLFLSYAIITAIFLGIGLKNYYRKRVGIQLYIASFFVITYSAMFTTMRQAAAMAILFYLYSLENPTWKRRIILWACILCTHYGFIILLPIEVIMVIREYRINRYIKILVPITSLFLGSYVNIASLIGKITSSLGLYSYMTSDQNYNTSAGVGIVNIILLIIYIYNNYRIKNNNIQKKTLEYISWGQMMYLSLMFLTMNMRWGNRIGYYYMVFMPFLIVDFLESLPLDIKSKKQVLYIFLIILYICFLWISKEMLGIEGYQWSVNFIG